jgi:hypothetical protein
VNDFSTGDDGVTGEPAVNSGMLPLPGVSGVGGTGYALTAFGLKRGMLSRCVDSFGSCMSSFVCAYARCARGAHTVLSSIDDRAGRTANTAVKPNMPAPSPGRFIDVIFMPPPLLCGNTVGMYWLLELARRIESRAVAPRRLHVDDTQEPRCMNRFVLLGARKDMASAACTRRTIERMSDRDASIGTRSKFRHLKRMRK